MKSSQTNTFTGGMLKDLHPMITPPNVLTDALNATIVTMNGNENVLLNDMGNAKIESAYLPAGYEPVGVKEYGGIIYVAAYNPQTGKGQVGSFPSPERNIDSSETESSIINLDDIFKNYKDNELVTFTKRFKLLVKEDSTDRNIYPGDKFSLYTDLSKYKNYLSHYNTYDANSVDSYRKNNLISLDIAVLDSNSNLRIITDLLKRFDESGKVILFETTDSVEKKLNTGYFIQNTTKEGSDVLSERIKNAVNIYNNKVAGLLYLIETINSIQKFNVENDYEVIDDNTIKLKFNCHYFYNCPEDYIFGVEILYNNKVKTFQKTKTNIKWNEDELLYELNDTYELIIDKFQEIVNYSIIPYMTFSKMSGLEVKGTININKLNSGEIEINTWKYLVANNKVLLTLGLNAYIKETDHIEYIKLDFYDILHGNGETVSKTMKIDGKKNYSGIFTNNIDLPLSTVYKVKIYYKYIGQQVNNWQDNLIGIRTVISTPLLNDFYYTKDDYDLEVLNDGDTSKDFPFTLEIEAEIDLTSLSKESPIINTPSYLLVVNNIPNSTKIELSNKQVFKDLITVTPHLKNPENYPIELNSEKLQLTYDSTKVSHKLYDKSTKEEIKVNTDDTNNKINLNVIKYNYLNLEVDTEQIINLSLKGKYTKTNLTFLNMFKSIDANTLFGFDPKVKNSWWWIMPVEWVRGRSNHRDKIWGIIYQANYSARFTEEAEDKYEEIFTYDDAAKSDGEMYRDMLSSKFGIYNSILNYLKNTQGTPNVVLFSGAMNGKEVLEEGKTRHIDTDWFRYGGSLRPMNNYERNSDNSHTQYEYLWWLGTDNNYHLLSDFIISKDINYDHSANKEELFFPQALNNIFKNVLIYSDDSYESDKYYLYNVTSNIPQTSELELNTTILLKTSVESGESLFTPYSKKNNNTLSYLDIMEENCAKLGCTVGFHFIYNEENLVTPVTIKNTSLIKGMEDLYSKISNLNSNKVLSNAVEIDNNIYFYDSEGKDFNSASLYIKDLEGITRLSKSNSAINKLFTYQNGKIVVRYDKLENKKGNWKYYDRSKDGKGQLTFAHMPSFSIPGLLLISNSNKDKFEQGKLNS